MPMSSSRCRDPALLRASRFEQKILADLQDSEDTADRSATGLRVANAPDYEFLHVSVQ